MPGAKRKTDEDMWLTRESKKLKSGGVLSNVYASTLSKLRVGSRTFFQNLSDPSRNDIEAISSGSDNALRNMSTISRNHSNPLIEICEACSSTGYRMSNPDICTCSYCDKRLCHLNFCRSCQIGFCSSCALQKYDGDSVMAESYVCIGCFSSRGTRLN